MNGLIHPFALPPRSPLHLALDLPPPFTLPPGMTPDAAARHLELAIDSGRMAAHAQAGILEELRRRYDPAGIAAICDRLSRGSPRHFALAVVLDPGLLRLKSANDRWHRGLRRRIDAPEDAAWTIESLALLTRSQGAIWLGATQTRELTARLGDELLLEAWCRVSATGRKLLKSADRELVFLACREFRGQASPLGQIDAWELGLVAASTAELDEILRMGQAVPSTRSRRLLALVAQQQLRRCLVEASGPSISSRGSP